jgi:1-acyl-sn-glycerol-3-phosphate acyltransferase
MRLALEARAPIVPFAFIGGEEAVPTLFHLKTLARILRAPYIPVPPQLLPVPLPVACHVHFGEPLRFEGTGTEVDEVIHGYVEVVREKIRGLIAEGLRIRGRAFRFAKVRPEEAEVARAGGAPPTAPADAPPAAAATAPAAEAAR